MAHDVFISYSSKDKPIADAVCANIEAAGIRCWVAPRTSSRSNQTGHCSISARAISVKLADFYKDNNNNLSVKI